ncbi:hypothetical protein HK405_012094, partial [Cladochytrium tenue]
MGSGSPASPIRHSRRRHRRWRRCPQAPAITTWIVSHARPLDQKPTPPPSSPVLLSRKPLPDRNDATVRYMPVPPRARALRKPHLPPAAAAWSVYR